MTRRGGAGDVLVRLVAHPRASPRGLLQGEPRTARCLQPRSPARSPTSRNGHVTVTQRLRTGHAAAAQRPHNCKLPAARSPCLRSRSSRSSQAHRSPPTPRHPARAPSTLSTASWQCRSDLRPQRPAPAAPAARAHRVCAQSSSGGGRCRHALPPGLRPARPVSTPPPARQSLLQRFEFCAWRLPRLQQQVATALDQGVKEQVGAPPRRARP